MKASQCFTKYRWRSAAEAAAAGDGQAGVSAQPCIVATQVVSDFLTPDDDSLRYAQAMGKPVTIMTYKMAFFRV